MDTPKLFVDSFDVEFLGGDESFLLTVAYKDEDGQEAGVPDRFSFSTSAKLIKFIKKNLLPASGSDEPAAEVVE